jgi:hypothetical protein
MVDDVATMILMVLFYKNMWERRSEGLAVAERWEKAIVEFHHLDTESAKQILKQVGKELRKAKDEGANPNQIVQNMEQELLQRRTDSISTSSTHSTGHHLYSLGMAPPFVKQTTQG